MIQVIGSKLSQWDVGRRVSVSNSNATHIHFANQGDSKAVIMEIQNGEVLIPDYLLQTGKQVMAYSVLDGVTLEKEVFFVHKRERPENYIYEHDDRNYVYELIEEAENAVKNANETLESFKEAVESGEYHGTTPHIGANENWFIGEEDTGKTSRGEPGYTPKKGVDYFTPDEVNAIVEEAASKASAGDIDLSKYAKKEDIPTNVSAFKNDAGYLTKHQDLSAYAKKTDIPTVPTNVSSFTNDKGYITEDALNGYAKEEDIPSLDGYAKTEDIPSLDGYAKTADIPTDAHINDLINTALGVIENAKY